MARSLPPLTWQRGFAENASVPTPAWADQKYYVSENEEHAHYAVPDGSEKPTSTVANEHGLSSLRSWPSLYNGTESQKILPSWWKPPSEVDVLICGGEYSSRSCDIATNRTAGPFGLAMALSLARQGITFRIVGTSMPLLYACLQYLTYIHLSR